jgi:ketosteroid isomerase-like protein
MAKTVGAILGDIYDAWRAHDLDWLASYLPDDFCHVVHIPESVHPLGGARKGKRQAIERWAVLLARYEILRYDTDDIIIERNRAAVEIPMHYRDRETGTVLETTKANFWTMEDGWPVKLTEYYDLAELQNFFAPVVPTAQA